MRKNRRELFEKRDDGPSDFREAFIRKQLLLRVSVSLERGKRRGGGGGVGIVTGSYFNSRRTFPSRMKYQIYRSLRRSESGCRSDIEKLASR